MDKSWRFAVVGNVKKTRIDENGELRYGTSAFKGNTKVYLCGRLWDERFPDTSMEEVPVLGLNRKGRYYCFERIPTNLIENLRITRVYKPAVLNMMFEECCSGWWGSTQKERDDASAFLKRLKAEQGIE